MGLSGDLAAIVPADVTWAQAKIVWQYGVLCAKQALSSGHWQDVSLPGEATRQKSLDTLMAWEGSFIAVEAAGGLGDPMDYGNWDALRTQVFGACANLAAIDEGNATAKAALATLPDDLADQAKVVATAAVSAAGTAATAAFAGVGLGIVLLGAGALAYLYLSQRSLT